MSPFHKETKKVEKYLCLLGEKERWRPLSLLLRNALQRPLFLYLCFDVQKHSQLSQRNEMGINLRNSFLTRIGTEWFCEQEFYVTAVLRVNTSFSQVVDQSCWGLWDLNNLHGNSRYLQFLSSYFVLGVVVGVLHILFHIIPMEVLWSYISN